MHKENQDSPLASPIQAIRQVRRSFAKQEQVKKKDKKDSRSAQQVQVGIFVVCVHKALSCVCCLVSTGHFSQPVKHEKAALEAFYGLLFSTR